MRNCAARGAFHEIKDDTMRVSLEEMAEELRANGEGETARKYGGDFWSQYSTIKNTSARMKNIEAEELIKQQLVDMELRDWQKWVVAMLEFQGDRKILFVVDQIGGFGQTWLTKWYHVNLQAAVNTTTKRDDVAYAYNGESMSRHIGQNCFDVLFRRGQLHSRYLVFVIELLHTRDLRMSWSCLLSR